MASLLFAIWVQELEEMAVCVLALRFKVVVYTNIGEGSGNLIILGIESTTRRDMQNN